MPFASFGFSLLAERFPNLILDDVDYTVEVKHQMCRFLGCHNMWFCSVIVMGKNY